MSDPDLLVAIPTHNRAELAEIAVRSLMQQANTSGRWQVLVVDNASSDDTQRRIGALAQEWQRLRVVHEPSIGSSAARNRAISECSAGHILFVDDECKFPVGYVDRALAIIDDRQPKLFGGPVHPWYREPPPAWFLDRYGSYSLPDATGRAPRIYLSGANIGFERRALLALGGFDVRLGMRGTAPGYGEETDLELRLLAHFGPQSVWFDPEFINFHLVLPSKYRWGPLVREHFRRGLARASLQRRSSGGAKTPSPEVPECLRPQPRPTVSRERIAWQNIAYEYGLPVVRLLGYGLARAGFGRAADKQAR